RPLRLRRGQPVRDELVRLQPHSAHARGKAHGHGVRGELLVRQRRARPRRRRSQRPPVPADERVRPLPRQPDRGRSLLAGFRGRSGGRGGADVSRAPARRGDGRGAARPSSAPSRGARERRAPGAGRGLGAAGLGGARRSGRPGGDPRPEGPRVIAYRSLPKTFGTHTAVRALDLVVRAGAVVALLGPDGSGKTPSLKAAAGLIQPTSGEVLIGDPALPALDPSARAVLSFLPPRVAFPDALTGREVLEFYRGLRNVERARSDEVLRLAALNGSRARALRLYSVGMVQRLALAVATLPAAPVLLLDEPPAALDPDGLCAFYGLVTARRREGKTVLFTSHHLGDVERLADRFAVLVEGRLVAELTARELQDRLAERGVLRPRVGAVVPGLLDEVRKHAPGARWGADELIVPGPASERPRIIDVVRGAGAEIRGLTAEEGRLDSLYRELVGEHA